MLWGKSHKFNQRDYAPTRALGRHFEGTFENSLWGKIVQLQPMWLCIYSRKQFENTFENLKNNTSTLIALLKYLVTFFLGANSFSCPAIPANCGFRHHAGFEYETVTSLFFITTDFHEVGNGGWIFCWLTAIIINHHGCRHHHHYHHYGCYHHHGCPHHHTTIIMGALIIITSPIPILSSPCSPVVSGIRVPAAEGIVHSLRPVHTMAALF